MLTATFANTYKKFDEKTRTSKVIYRYFISGSASDIENYLLDQGDFARVDEATGKPLFFSNEYCGPRLSLLRSQKGRYFLDTSMLDAQASLAAKYGGNLGQAIANAAIAQFLFQAPAAAKSAPAPAQDIPELVDEDIDMALDTEETQLEENTAPAESNEPPF